LSHSLSELAAIVNGHVVGDPGIEIDSVNDLIDAGDRQITFYINRKYKHELQATSAAAVILDQASVDDCPVAAIVVKNPHAAYARIAGLLYPQTGPTPGIHPQAIIGDGCDIDASAWIGPHVTVGDGAMIGAGVYIGPGCIIGQQAIIGKDCWLWANVSVMHDCVLGERVLVHPGAVIGCDGFGQADDQGRWIKIPQVGRAVIHDDVEIGANVAIDRGAIKDTVIGQGVKLDNLVHVAHNVEIGANTVIAALSGIAGSTVIGKHCMFGGKVAISGHLTITDNVVLAGAAVVRQNVHASGAYSSGGPLEPLQSWTRNYLRMKQLNDMAKQIQELQTRLAELETKG
jgi:UDP-3-O-[3-hydroxymyristoyl] glucosamine N-acyltransferase